jgi:uncharacterized protein
VSRVQRKYVPQLANMQAVCEHNYSRFLRVLPDCDTEDLSYRFTVGEGHCYQMTILDSARYTSTISVEQISQRVPVFLKPKMVVRLYHDARMAEVISSQNAGTLAPSYDYPNSNMHAKNEKQMVNVFLAEWLQFCISLRPQVLNEA